MMELAMIVIALLLSIGMIFLNAALLELERRLTTLERPYGKQS